MGDLCGGVPATASICGEAPSLDGVALDNPIAGDLVVVNAEVSVDGGGDAGDITILIHADPDTQLQAMMPHDDLRRLKLKKDTSSKTVKLAVIEEDGDSGTVERVSSVVNGVIDAIVREADTEEEGHPLASPYLLDLLPKPLLASCPPLEWTATPNTRQPHRRGSFEALPIGLVSPDLASSSPSVRTSP